MAAVTAEQRDELLRSWFAWDENPTNRERVIAYENAVRDVATVLGFTTTELRILLAVGFGRTRNRHDALDAIIDT